MNIHSLRRDYLKQVLHKKDLDSNPFVQFINWLDAAIGAEVIEPNALALATATKEAIPSCRMVLMKHFDDTGLVFFTNVNSRKAKELQENPNASGVFFWDKLERQVIIQGKVEKVSREEVVKYFASRPHGSQLGTAASNQDEPVESRKILEAAYDALEVQYRGQNVPCPESWTGFRIIPNRFEFWQGRSNRLHDRFCYSLSNGSWTITRLSP
jgi:pyridoxamine 5'-phosphate oxidase